jgi:hypothetical protein
LNDAEKVEVLKLMELQRHAMLMYTSCGWFFDELSGIETIQVIQYAARVLQLAGELFKDDLEPMFLERLSRARSNLPEHGDGRVIYGKFVKPAMIDWPKAAAHYAISSLFHEYGTATRIFSFTCEDEERRLAQTGKTRLAIGRVRVRSEITQESEVLGYAILYMGEHSLIGGVREVHDPPAYAAMAAEIHDMYQTADFPQVIRLIDQHFGNAPYTLKSLFKDEQRRILNEILASAREDLDSRFRLITDRYAPLMKFLQGAGAPLPPGLEVAWDLTLHSEIRRHLGNGYVDLDRFRALIDDARTRGTHVLNAGISYAAKERMERVIRSIAENPEDLGRIRELQGIASLLMPLPLELNVAEVQNTYWGMKAEVLARLRERASKGESQAQEVLNVFLALGEQLEFAPSALA